MKVTTEVCLNRDDCIFRPLCLFVHEDGGNDQLAALQRNTVEIIPSPHRNISKLLETFPSWEERKMKTAQEDLHKGQLQEARRPARLIGDVGPAEKKMVAVCKSGARCTWKPRCRFGHPEGGNMDHNLELVSNKETSQRQRSGDCEESERRKRLNKDRGNVEKSTNFTKAGGDQRTPPKMRRSTKQCRSGPSCTWKPFCLFLHKEGGNDHELAYQNFTAKKGREVKEEKARAVQKAAKKIEKKFDWEGGSSYSNMLAWCEVAEEVNKEALAQVNEWVLDLFVRGQVELLGGDEDFYNEVDASLKDLELVEGIKDAQRKLYSWRMDFFLDKFKSVYLEDPISTWTTDGFDDNHCLDTIPMQITLNFDEVMKLASTKRDLDQEHERFFFAHDENLSYVAEHKFGEQYQEDDEELDEDEEWNKEADIDITLPKHLIATVNRGEEVDSVILEKKKNQRLNNLEILASD